MIRFLGHLLRRLLLLGLLVWVAAMVWPMAESAWQRFDPRGEAAADLARLANAAPNTVYVLDQERWVEFPIPSQGNLLKVVSNANLDSQSVAQTDTDWSYALRYQLADGLGRVLKDAVYHHRTAVSWYRPPGAKQPLTAAFYPAGQPVPADGRLLMINFGETAGAMRLRLRLASRAVGINSVVVRVYAREHLFEPPDAHRWQRTIRRQQEALAQASVYGLELLRESEQVNLLRLRWNPVGPLGIEGRDYHSQRLYSALDVEAEPLRAPIPPAGLYVDRDLHGTLPIPEPAERITLEFLEPAQTPPATGSKGTAIAATAEVELLWQGPRPTQRATYRVPLSGSSSTLWSEKLGGGLLEVVAPRPLIVKATRHQAGGEALDLLPEPLYLRLYRLEPDQPLEFAITHVGGQPTFWRVDLRLATPDPAPTATVRYEFLDARGGVLRQGTLALTGVASLYDSLIGGNTPIERVSEAASYGFALPATVVRVRLTAASPVLANAYTRPPDLRRNVRVPEDYQPADRAKARGQPVWFPVLPLAAQAWMLEGRTALLSLQTRPPQRDPEVLAGRYDWQDYYPNGDWRGRYLLNPRDPQAPLREEALGAVFQPLAAGVPVRVDLRGPPGRLMVDASLLVLRDSDQPDPVRISVDGQPVYAGVLTLRRGELRLPPLPVGPRTIRVETAQPARWFINYTAGPAGSLVRRLAYRLDQQALEFVYAKTSAGVEVLSGVLQRPAGDNRRARLRVTVEMPGSAILGPFSHPTVREWLYDIQFDTDSPVPVLGTPSEQVGLGQRFFLPLGDDVPPGNYRVRIWLEESSGYLALYRVVPGLPVVLELFSEKAQW